MSATYKYIYDCEELLKNLNNKSKETIQCDTAIATFLVPRHAYSFQVY